MIWGSMSLKGRGGLYFLPTGVTMNADRYITVLKDKLEPHFSIHGCNLLMQDGAPCHNAKKVSLWLRENGTRTLEWPGNSPDLNPLENCWKKLKYLVAKRQSRNYLHLIEIIKQIWYQEISADYCETLVKSMP